MVHTDKVTKVGPGVGRKPLSSPSAGCSLLKVGRDCGMGDNIPRWNDIEG